MFSIQSAGVLPYQVVKHMDGFGGRAREGSEKMFAA